LNGGLNDESWAFKDFSVTTNRIDGNCPSITNKPAQCQVEKLFNDFFAEKEYDRWYFSAGN
jgi:hypothetical protein